MEQLGIVAGSVENVQAEVDQRIQEVEKKQDGQVTALITEIR